MSHTQVSARMPTNALRARAEMSALRDSPMPPDNEPTAVSEPPSDDNADSLAAAFRELEEQAAANEKLAKPE